MANTSFALENFLKFLKNIFDSWFVESTNVESVDMKSWLYFYGLWRLRSCLPTWYESRFSVWQSLKSWMGLTFLQREIDQDLKPGSEMSTQIDVINLLNIPNAPMFSDWISSEELSGWEFSDSNLFDWSQTSKHSFPHYRTKLMSHFWIQTV